MDKKRIIELRGKAQAIRPTMHVGKEGVTESVVEELKAQLKRNKLVKVKVLPSVEADKRDTAMKLSEAAGAVLIEIRGNTVVMAKQD